jgi:hypothetical protein
VYSPSATAGHESAVVLDLSIITAAPAAPWDVAVGAGCTHNGIHNGIAYTDPDNGDAEYTGYMHRFPTSGTPGSNDVLADPEFFDYGRNLAGWAVHKGVADGGDTNAEKVAAARALLLTDPTLVYGDLIPWVRAGYAPTNAAYDGTAHDSGTPGAVPFQAVSGSGSVALAVVIDASIDGYRESYTTVVLDSVVDANVNGYRESYTTIVLDSVVDATVNGYRQSNALIQLISIVDATVNGYRESYGSVILDAIVDATINGDAPSGASEGSFTLDAVIDANIDGYRESYSSVTLEAIVDASIDGYRESYTTVVLDAVVDATISGESPSIAASGSVTATERLCRSTRTLRR